MIIICFILFFAVCISMLCLPHVIKTIQLEIRVNKVEEYISNGEFDKARMEAKQIVDDSDWSDESKEKWDEVREDYLDLIDAKQAQKNGYILLELSIDDLIGEDVITVVKQFIDEGFTNIKTEKNKSKISNLIHKKGKVKEIKINGKNDIPSGKYYKPDEKIVITYYG